MQQPCFNLLLVISISIQDLSCTGARKRASPLVLRGAREPHLNLRHLLLPALGLQMCLWIWSQSPGSWRLPLLVRLTFHPTPCYSSRRSSHHLGLVGKLVIFLKQGVHEELLWRFSDLSGERELNECYFVEAST